MGSFATFATSFATGFFIRTLPVVFVPSFAAALLAVCFAIFTVGFFVAGVSSAVEAGSYRGRLVTNERRADIRLELAVT